MQLGLFSNNETHPLRAFANARQLTKNKGGVGTFADKLISTNSIFPQNADFSETTSRKAGIMRKQDDFDSSPKREGGCLGKTCTCMSYTPQASSCINCIYHFVN